MPARDATGREGADGPRALRAARAASHLSFALTDGVRDDSDVKLQRVAAASDGGTSKHAIAMALDNYAALARQQVGKPEALSSFDLTLLDEAPLLAKRLRQHSADKKVGSASEESRAALELRNRLVALRYERMSQVRATARYVFRHHPEIVQRATSAYQRRRRARARVKS